jgi:hypothetical protein
VVTRTGVIMCSPSTTLLKHTAHCADVSLSARA